jgi:tetratricopeptide (TPR) repeat protein
MIRALLALALALPAFADTGNAVCARCHAAIARQYEQTGMARTSGRAGQASPREQFNHPNITPDYRIHLDTAARQLEFFLGSGHIGRSYLFRKSGQLFQSPYSYYSAPQKWALSPGYETKPYPELTRAVEPACLQCHASRLQPAASAQPFLQPGVGCERCHGPGERHVAAPARANIVNPARLAPRARDSVCAQCHLTGAARVARAGRERFSYTPGQLLSDSIAVFVSAQSDISATSHYEKLAASQCKQRTGDALWCGSCHQPHSDSSPNYYNSRCQSCHTTKSCQAGHKQDCIACHMPKRAGERSIEHLAFTDHSIPRRPRTPQSQSISNDLKEFWTGQASPRDTALASASAGLDAAFDLLRQAAPAHPADVPLQLQLAQYYERRGEAAPAAALYERILKLDPANTTALINLGIYYISNGKPPQAISLWQRALAANPALVNARLNLAVAQAQSGDTAAARKSLALLLDYEPQHPAALRLLQQLP